MSAGYLGSASRMCRSLNLHGPVTWASIIPTLRLGVLESAAAVTGVMLKKLAHNSTIPSLAGNSDLRPLQDLILAEKNVLVS